MTFGPLVGRPRTYWKHNNCFVCVDKQVAIRATVLPSAEMRVDEGAVGFLCEGVCLSELRGGSLVPYVTPTAISHQVKACLLTLHDIVLIMFLFWSLLASFPILFAHIHFKICSFQFVECHHVSQFISFFNALYNFFSHMQWYSSSSVKRLWCVKSVGFPFKYKQCTKGWSAPIVCGEFLYQMELRTIQILRFDLAKLRCKYAISYCKDIMVHWAVMKWCSSVVSVPFTVFQVVSSVDVKLNCASLHLYFSCPNPHRQNSLKINQHKKTHSIYVTVQCRQNWRNAYLFW